RECDAHGVSFSPLAEALLESGRSTQGREPTLDENRRCRQTACRIGRLGPTQTPAQALTSSELDGLDRVAGQVRADLPRARADRVRRDEGLASDPENRLIARP